MIFALVSPAAGQLAEPGVSVELAHHRAATITDVFYDVHFHIPAERRHPVTGVLDLGFTLEEHGPVILDFARHGAIRAVSVQGVPVAIEIVHNHLVLPAGALSRGRNQVRIEFTAGDGPLNRHDDFLYTLFVPDRAHEAFPAFDQPDMKAPFRLTLTVPASWEAVANGEVLERLESGDRAVYRFQETEPLSTYFFSFAAGRFQVETAERGGRTMRLYHRETDQESVARNLPAIFDLHATSLDWLEEYTGIPYPFGKFDLVAIPAFQYNGMEHPGAILYRASSLFLDPAATRGQELGRASLIAHETAHMWFGDLVTMPWFDDVWMKEVFANFMAAKIVNPSFPDLDHELRFFLAHYPVAYRIDRTPGANPIRQELENLDDAASLYGPIIYQKAPIVMRQLERLTGEEAFRRAVRHYLEAHAFGNASWLDLVTYLDDVTPLDVPAWSRVWVDEPGRPTITIHRGEGRLVLTQEDPRGRGLLWDQVLYVRIPHQDGWVEEKVRLDSETAQVPELPGELVRADVAVLPNGAGLGYGLFRLDDLTRQVLLRTLPELEDALARAVAWVALHELMMEGRVDPSAMLELAATTVEREDDELVAQAVLDDLTALYWSWVPAAERARWSRTLETMLWERLEAVEAASHKAAVFNAWRAVASTQEALALMESIWAGDAEVPGVTLAEQDHTRLALHLALHRVEEAGPILDAQARRIQNPDRRDRFEFIRQAVAPDPSCRAAFFAGLAEPANRHREEWVVAALGYLHHPLRAEESVPLIRPALDLLREVRDTGDIFFPQRWLNSVLAGHHSPAAANVVREFIEAQDDYPPRLMEKILQAADPLFRRSVMAR